MIWSHSASRVPCAETLCRFSEGYRVGREALCHTEGSLLPPMERRTLCRNLPAYVLPRRPRNVRVLRGGGRSLDLLLQRWLVPSAVEAPLKYSGKHTQPRRFGFSHPWFVTLSAFLMKFPPGSDMYGWERLWAVGYRLIFRYLVCRQDWALLKVKWSLNPEIGPFYPSRCGSLSRSRAVS